MPLPNRVIVTIHCHVGIVGLGTYLNIDISYTAFSIHRRCILIRTTVIEPSSFENASRGTRSILNNNNIK